MGQGHYIMVGYGVKSEGFEAVYAVGDNSGQFRVSVDCDAPYTVIPLAVSDAWLACEWSVAHLMGNDGVWTLSELLLSLSSDIETAKKHWVALQARALLAGVTVPDADLLFVRDYD